VSLIYLTEVSLFFSIIPEHIEAFGHISFIAAEIRLLHLEPFTNSHFHFFIIVECARMGQMHQCAWGL
jgi:hypothetical protein